MWSTVWESKVGVAPAVATDVFGCAHVSRRRLCVTEPRTLTPTHHVAVVAACCADLKQAKDVAVGGPSM